MDISHTGGRERYGDISQGRVNISLLLKDYEICAPPHIDRLTANYIYWLIMRACNDPKADDFAKELKQECER